MAKRNTKEIILLQALNLFSERGYDGVGLRDIGRAVGIRESGIYKHYGSKQEILDSLLLAAAERYELAARSYQLPQQIAETLTGERDLDDLITMCAQLFHFYLIDEYGSKMRRLLTIEQFRQTKAGQLFHDAIIDKGLNTVTKVFAELIDKGYFIGAEPAVAAIQFYSPLYLLLSKYDRLPERHTQAIDSLTRHIKQFKTLYIS